MNFNISSGGIGLMVGSGHFWGGFIIGPRSVWGRLPLVGTVQWLRGAGWTVDRWAEVKRESRGEMLCGLHS